MILIAFSLNEIGLIHFCEFSSEYNSGFNLFSSKFTVFKLSAITYLQLVYSTKHTFQAASKFGTNSLFLETTVDESY